MEKILNNVHLIASFIGAVLSVTIVFLVRRDHISPLVAARWFLISILVLFVSFFPNIVDDLGMSLGIGYPPIIPILIALAGAMIKILLMDIENQKMRVKLDRVIQRLAIIENAVESKTVIKAKFDSNDRVRTGS